MTKLNQCTKCKTYTMQETHCNTKTKSAHYKFLQLRDAPNNFKRKTPKSNH